MRTIAICNLKGGVGKTTTTVNLGASLARNGKRVLLIDCDPQGNLTSWLRSEPQPGAATLYEILRGQATVRAAAMPTRWDNLSVVPASPKLHEIDRGALAGERVLWARRCEDYDYTLLDCSASPGVVLANALTAAEEVVVPVQAKGMALSGIRRLCALIQDIATRGNTDIDLSGILVSLFDGRTRISRVVLGELRAEYGAAVFDTVIHEDVKLSEAADRRKPINHFAPSSRGTAEFAAIAYELMSRAHMAPSAASHAMGMGSLQLPTAPAAAFPASAIHAGAAGNVAGRRDIGASPASAHHTQPSTSPLGQD